MFDFGEVEKSNHKTRLDTVILKMGFVSSRQRAIGEILSGNVFVNNKKIVKAGFIVKEGSNIKIRKKKFDWVSRGGLKLFNALEKFDITFKNKICLDIGSSTGGFSDVLLSKGVSRIFCVEIIKAIVDLPFVPVIPNIDWLALLMS